MKRFIITITLLIALVGSVFAGDAGRKYTKATINGESAKIYADADVEADFEEMFEATFVYNSEVYYRYEVEKEPIKEGEYNYYSKKGKWSKVVFKDRIEFFYCTSFSPIGWKYTFTSDFYEYALIDTVANCLGNLGKRAGNVARQFN